VLAFAAVAVVSAGWVLVHDPGPVQAVPSPASTATATAEPVVSLWLGDSYTVGTGARSPDESEACLTAKALGWACERDAQGGTGFVADGHFGSKTYRPLGGRLEATIAKYDPDVVVIDAGRNDWSIPRDDVKAAIRSYFQRVDQAWPDTVTVVVAPYILGPGDGTPHGASWIGAYEKTLAGKYGWTFIDPVAAGWPAHTAKLTISDGVHPSPEGHAFIAEHLAPALANVNAQVK
jgi:lysophospholipase L1-like esterase